MERQVGLSHRKGTYPLHEPTRRRAHVRIRQKSVRPAMVPSAGMNQAA
jgi:hypothetical protein